jgi:ectoine hydroxylase-related dioxygenase (phytanoyl-CoA dioxygenase family)
LEALEFMSNETTNIPAPATIDLKSGEIPATIMDSAILQQGVELFLQHGYLIVKNAMDCDFVQKLRDEFMANYEAYFFDKEYDDALQVGHKRTMVTINMEGAFSSSDYYAPPKIFPLLEFLLSKRMIISGLGCVVSLPGAKDQHIHRDYDNIYDTGFHYDGADAWLAKAPPYAITVAIPLVPITSLTGSTRFWPGTHLSKVAKNDPNLGPGVEFAADLGSCILFDYRILHGGVANRSDGVRPLLYNIYTRPWFKDPVNYEKQQPISITEEQFKKLPDQHQGMLAWAIEGPALKSQI